VNPYLLAGAGYGWEDTKLTRWQCSQPLLSGPVVAGGTGVDVPIYRSLVIGLEYRVTTLPLDDSGMCTLALIPQEPRGPPRDFLPQRIALTIGVYDAF
jgi:hypothetical protein